MNDEESLIDQLEDALLVLQYVRDEWTGVPLASLDDAIALTETAVAQAR